MAPNLQTTSSSVSVPDRSGSTLAAWFAIGVTLATLAGGAVLWLTSAGGATQSEEPAPAPSASAALAATPKAPAEFDALRALALLRERDPDRAPPITERHQLLDAIRETEDAPRLDLQMHAALDLLQADQSAAPCLVFAQALARLEREPRADLLSIIEAASIPHKGPECDGLTARHTALVERLRPEPVAIIEDVPDEDETDAAAEAAEAKRRSKSRSRRRPRRRPEPAATTPPPEPVVDPTPPTLTKPTRRGTVAKKLDEELHPHQ